MQNAAKYLFERPIKVLMWVAILYFGYKFFQDENVHSEDVVHTARRVVIWLGHQLQAMGKG